MLTLQIQLHYGNILIIQLFLVTVYMADSKTDEQFPHLYTYCPVIKEITPNSIFLATIVASVQWSGICL